MPRDALWVLPSGATTVVTVDDDGSLIEPIPDAVRASLAALAEAAPEATLHAPPPAPPPAAPRHKRGRHSRH